MNEKKALEQVKIPPIGRSITEGNVLMKRRNVSDLHLPRITSPNNYLMKGLPTSQSNSTSHTTHPRLHASRTIEIGLLDLATTMRPLQATRMFKKKSLWPLLNEMMRLRDNRQNLPVLEAILDSIRENLVMINFIGEMPQKREIEIIHEKLSSCFRRIYREVRTLPDTEIFTRKFLSEIRFSIQPLTQLFSQYIDSINEIRKFLASISDISSAIDKESTEFAPRNQALSIKPLTKSIMLEHERLTNLINEMKCVVRHSSNRLRPLVNAQSGDKIKQEFEKIATRAIKFYEKSYQEVSYITRVSHKDLKNYLFQMESELAVITPYYKRYLQLNGEISKVVVKQEKYTDLSNRIKALQEEIENFYQLQLARNTQMPVMETTSPEKEDANLAKLLENINSLSAEILTHRKKIFSEFPSEDASILVNQLYDLANKNRDFICEAQRNVEKMEKTIEALQALKQLSTLMQELTFKHRTLRDEIEVYLNYESDEIPDNQLENVTKFFEAKREELRFDLLNYFSQILGEVTKIKTMHPELEKYANSFESTARNCIGTIEGLILKLCDQSEEKGVAIYEIYENYRIIMKEEAKCFPNFLNNPELLPLLDDLIDIALQRAANLYEEEDEDNIAVESDSKFAAGLKEGLTTLKALNQIFAPLVNKYFLNPERNLDYFEEFSIEVPNPRERAELLKTSELDWEISFIASEQLRYINAFEECLTQTKKISSLLSLDVLINSKAFESMLTGYYEYQGQWATFEGGFNNHKGYSDALFCFNRKIVQAVNVLVTLRTIFENRDYAVTPESALKISQFLDSDTDVFPELTAIKDLVESISEALILIADTSDAVENIVNLWYKKSEIDFTVIRKVAERNEASKALVAEKTQIFQKKFAFLDKHQSMACRFAIYKTESIFLSFFLKFADIKNEFNGLEETSWELIRAEKSIVTLKSGLLQKAAEIKNQLEAESQAMDHPNEIVSDLQTYFLEYLKNLLGLQAIEIQSDIELNILENCAPIEEAVNIMKSDRFISKFYELIWRRAIKKEQIPVEIQNTVKKYGMIMTLAGSVFYRTSTKAYIGRIMVIIEAASAKFNCKLEDYVRMSTECNILNQ